MELNSMVKVPKELIKDLMELAEVAEVPFEEVKKEFLDILKLPLIKESTSFITDAEKSLGAYNVIRARWADRIESQGSPYEGSIVEIVPTKIVNIKKKDDSGTTKNHSFKVAELIGVMVPVSKDDGKNPLETPQPSFASIKLYDDATKIVDDELIQRGKSYRINLNGKKNNKGYYDLTANSKPQVTEIDLKTPALKDILPKIFKPITIAEAPLQTSKGSKDIKLMRAIVKSSRAVNKKDGKGMIGFYNVIDHSIDTRAFKQGSKANEFPIRCDPAWIKYDTGSDLLFLGNISDSAQYGIGMWANIVLPVLGIPLSVSYNELEETQGSSTSGNEPISDDAVDMSDLME